MATTTIRWHRIVSFGSGPYRMPPVSAWPNRDAATAALQRWRDGAGWEAGTREAAHNVCIYGPYRTRAEARDGDISERPATVTGR